MLPLSLSRLVLLGCALVVLTSCERREDLIAPPPETASAAAGTADAEPAYYFRPGGTSRDIRIPLQLEPSELVIEAASDEDAVTAITSRGLQVGSVRAVPHAAPGHRLVRLAPGPSRAQVEAAAVAMREDPRVKFAGHAYTTARGDTLTLVNRLVVRFRNDVGGSEIDQFVESAGLGVLRAAEPAAAKPTWWLTYPRDRDPLEVAAEVHRHPLVRWAEPDRIGRAKVAHHVPSDPLYTQQYYLNNGVTLNGVPVDVNAEDAWLMTKGSSDIAVAVLGSGIDGSHPELSSRRKGGPCHPGWDEAFKNDFTGGAWSPGVQDCSSGTCTNPTLYPYHETAVAGIIAAQHNGTGTVGIAPGVMMVSARTILPPEFSTSVTPAQEADAINWAWGFCGADVVNGSYENAFPSTAVADAIADGVSDGRTFKGTVFVFAGGNASSRAAGVVHPVAYPAAYAGAIAVGAIDRFGAVTNYSPYGDGGFGCPPTVYCVPPAWGSPPAIDVVAPSGYFKQGPVCPSTPGASQPDVSTTDVAGGEGECSGNYMPNFSGTSASAPQVAAAAALLLTVGPNLTSAQVRSKLRDDADAWGPTEEYGQGKLNIGAALGVTVSAITNVSIGGSLEVRPNVNCLWSASISGGTPPYTFGWFKNGAWVGSGSSLSMSTGTTSFTLRLDVEDQYHQSDSTSVSVTVSGSASECTL